MSQMMFLLSDHLCSPVSNEKIVNLSQINYLFTSSKPSMGQLSPFSRYVSDKASVNLSNQTICHYIQNQTSANCRKSNMYQHVSNPTCNLSRIKHPSRYFEQSFCQIVFGQVFVHFSLFKPMFTCRKPNCISQFAPKKFQATYHTKLESNCPTKHLLTCPYRAIVTLSKQSICQHFQRKLPSTCPKPNIIEPVPNKVSVSFPQAKHLPNFQTWQQSVCHKHNNRQPVLFNSSG